MPLIQVPRSVKPCQVEFTDEGVERSKPGALYFTPSSTKKITKAEWEYIKKHHPHLASQLIVVPFDETKGRIAKQKAAEAASQTPAPPRPKDKMSKAKQRAKSLLDRAAKKVKPAGVAPVPATPAPVEPTDDKSKKSKK